MPSGFGKSISVRLGLAAKLHRARAAGLLAKIGLYPGQETILKALLAQDGRTMGELAEALSVRPPTVTKMVSRLGVQGYVERKAQTSDARQARVFLTASGLEKTNEIDAVWKELEIKTVEGLDAKDKKRLRKLLRQVARNLGQELEETADDLDLDDADEALIAEEDVPQE